MENDAVTIAAFARKDDPGLLALIQNLKHQGSPYWLEEITDPETPQSYRKETLPVRLRTKEDDGPLAYQACFELFSKNDPYVEISEEELEALALSTPYEDHAYESNKSEIVEETPTPWSRILEDLDVRPHVREGVTCPIDQPLVEWIDEHLLWISEHLFQPTERDTIFEEDYGGWDFENDLEDAEFVLHRTLELANLPNNDHINLYFMYAEGAAGYYHKEEDQHYIGIEMRTLWDTSELIDVVVHEVCHYQLIGLQATPNSDELLTDLLAVAYGFGLMKGNGWLLNQHSGHVSGGYAYHSWRVGRRGYLPRKMIAFAMALIEYRRNGYVFPGWYEQINKQWREDFIQSIHYIYAFSEEFKFLQLADS